MKKILVLLLVFLMAFGMFALTGCSSEDEPAPQDDSDAQTESDLAYVTDKGNLIIGITIYEPMNYYDGDGTLIGFDTEFAQAVCEKLGVTPEFLEINWDTKEIELKAKTIDCIWNGLTIDEERKENMLFSDAYIKNMQVAVIRAENADKYKDTASLADGSLVAEISSAGEKAIAADENLKDAAYNAMPKQTDALLEVKAGTADAAILDYVLADAMVGEGSDYSDLMIIDGLELNVEEYAIGFRLDSDLADAVNKAIEELAADGTLNTLAEKYGLENQLIFNQ